jgi:pimeloyl-ACP methyl ester carboxylesterase
MRLRKELRLAVNGIELACFEWGKPGGQQALLAHATGFHARCWDQVIALLPADWHVFALDMRGHGRSDNDGPFGWQQFGDDLLEVARQLDLADAVGVGHSMGGHCVTQVGAASPSTFARLVLVDPVISSPDTYTNASRHEFASVADHPIARRRSHFGSWQEMHERYKNRHPYDLWQSDVYTDYCQYGVVPSATGEGVDLACPGVIEASIYMGSFGRTVHGLIAKIDLPVTVLRAPPRGADSAPMDFAASPTWPELAAQFANGKDVFLPQLTHFMPMQDPHLIASHIISE